jgi:hypothetical protein
MRISILSNIADIFANEEILLMLSILTRAFIYSLVTKEARKKTKIFDR